MEYLNGPPRKGCHSRAEAKLPDISQTIPRHNFKSPDNDILCAWSLTFDSLTPEIHGSDNLVFFMNFFVCKKSKFLHYNFPKIEWDTDTKKSPIYKNCPSKIFLSYFLHAK